MGAEVCRCCGWTVLLADPLPDDALAACPECGQCLRVPSPWSNNDIALCDTQHLARLKLAELERAPEAALQAPIPAELSVRRTRPKGTPPASITEGLLGIVLGVMLLGGAVWSAGQGGQSALWAAFEACAALLLLVGGAFVLRTRLRRRRRITSARVVRLAACLSAESYDLGTPLAYHRANSAAQGVALVTGGLVFVAGVLSLWMYLHGVQRVRLLEVAVLAIPGGLVAVVQALWMGGQQVVVCPKGLVLCRGHRSDVWRWDSVVRTWLKPQPALKPLTAFTCRMRREDGEECVLDPRRDFFENQVVVRAQAEVAARLLPAWRRTLREGGTLDFEVFELTADGLYKNGHNLPFDELAASRVDAEHWTLQTISGQTFRWSIAKVPDLAALLTLLREQRRAKRSAVDVMPGARA